MPTHKFVQHFGLTAHGWTVLQPNANNAGTRNQSFRAIGIAVKEEVTKDNDIENIYLSINEQYQNITYKLLL